MASRGLLRRVARCPGVPLLSLALFYFLYIFNIYLFLAVLGLHCSAQASHCGGFSCCRARALGGRASVVVACRL